MFDPRIVRRSRALASFVVLLGIFLSSKNSHAEEEATFPLKQEKTRPKRIILVGASIGRGWNIPALPARLQNDDYAFEFVDVSGFDKSEELRKVFRRSETQPDAIIIKECAAYFPGDFGLYKNLIAQWVSECQKHGIVPIPATVVPVTRMHSFKKLAIDLLKLRNPFKTGSPFRHRRQKAIQEYNDWLRGFCGERKLSVLDLEKAVRKSDKNRYLRSRWAKIDGLHLNKKGYQVIDRIVIPTLHEADWPIKF